MTHYLRYSSMCFCALVGRQKFVREVLNAAPLVCEREEEAKGERLHFYRPAANNHIPEKLIISASDHQAKTHWQNIKKRQRQSERCDSSHQSPPTKRLSSSALTAEDIDLLNSYWGLSSCSIPQRAAWACLLTGNLSPQRNQNHFQDD